ncbi:MAG: hypothetical protein P8Y97_06975 [Candidatus Lokiarchaeota archaeon]
MINIEYNRCNIHKREEKVVDIKQNIIVEVLVFAVFSLILIFWFKMPLSFYFMVVIIIFGLITLIYLFNKYMNHRFVQSLNVMEREVEKYRKDQDEHQEQLKIEEDK